MDTAISLAERGLGQTWPNPSVGCVIVKDGVVMGRGWTQPGGRPHAENEALRRAGDRAMGSTVYVTLEPCAHQGSTPPCAQSLIDAEVRRVVIGIEDPDPRVNGKGVKMLKMAGIRVDIGVRKSDVEIATKGFLTRNIEGRPQISLKVATTLDGRIACASGDSKWVTGEAARRSGHLLRASHDAILVGATTATHDNPTLTCRLPGMLDRSPIRVIVDGGMRLPLSNKLVVDAKIFPTWLFTLSNSYSDSNRRNAYLEAGVEVIEINEDKNGNPDLQMLVSVLGDRGLTRLLIEGGGVIAAAFLKLGLIDDIFWYRASKIIGGDGLPAIAGMGIEEIQETKRMSRVFSYIVGDDVIERYKITG